MKNLIIFSSLVILALLFVNQNSNAGLNNQSLQYNAGDSAQSCKVCNVGLTSGGIKYKYLNKEFTFCCEGCEKSFKKEPAGYIKGSLHCPVCVDDDAKKDLSHTHDSVKYYFCGSGCKKKFEGDAQKYLDNYSK